MQGMHGHELCSHALLLLSTIQDEARPETRDRGRVGYVVLWYLFQPAEYHTQLCDLAACATDSCFDIANVEMAVLK